jgi:hypothetical protein
MAVAAPPAQGADDSLHLRNMFRQMNVDGDSHLSKTELCAAMAKLCPGAGIPELNTMYGMLDANGDLHISEKEFVTQMQALTRDMPSLTTDTAQHLSYRARQIDRAWHTIISSLWLKWTRMAAENATLKSADQPSPAPCSAHI